MKPVRYRFYKDCGCECEMIEESETYGEYVKYEDYKEIKEENEQLKKEITELKDYIEDKDNRINHPLKHNFKYWEVEE